MIDWSRVGELREEVGADDFDEILDLFLNEVEGTIEQLHLSCDKSQLQENLHFLKGSALSLGFQSFADLCQVGETRSATGQAASVDVAAIITSYEQSKSQFLMDLPLRDFG